MDESYLRQLIVKLLRPLDAISVENAARYGTPDINYIEGWIELKWKEKWPVRANTPLRVESFTSQQRAWMIRRAQAGGNIHLLLRVGKEWLLLPPIWSAINLGSTPRSDIEAFALSRWKKLPGFEEFSGALKTGREIGLNRN